MKKHILLIVVLGLAFFSNSLAFATQNENSPSVSVAIKGGKLVAEGE